jgi:putative flippase GtrA
MLSNKNERIRFAKFALVGISGTLIDFFFLNLFIQRFGIEQNSAKALSFSIAVFNNFLWNRLWTYPESRKLPFFKQFSQYLIVSIIGLLINISIFAFTNQFLIRIFNELLSNGFPLSPSVVSYNSSAAIATIVVLFWNYFANRFWTFRSIV